jgi:acyl-CoA synthetase (AMP-forming)/AMP-acid ligase II
VSGAELQTARQHGVADLLRRSARRSSDKTAIVYRKVRQSYADLDRAVNRTANALAARGVSAGERVALHSPNSYGFVVASLALARLGAIVVPVNFMLGADEVAFVLEHSGAIGLEGVPLRGEPERGQGVLEGVDDAAALLLRRDLAADLATGRFDVL